MIHLKYRAVIECEWETGDICCPAEEEFTAEPSTDPAVFESQARMHFVSHGWHIPDDPEQETLCPRHNRKRVAKGA